MNPSGRPSVIVVVTDDQGVGDLACQGNPWLHTPHLDRLAADSVRLTDFHVDPMCSPTRAALMTGRYSCRTGVWSTLRGRYLLRRDEVTLAQLFTEAGYATALCGKWHLGDNYPYRPEDRGFDEVLSFGGGVVGEIPDYWDNDYFDDVYRRNGVTQQAHGYCTDVWFAAAERFITRHRDDPFLCVISTNAPHNPHNVEPADAEPYFEAGLAESRARYYGMIARIDQNVGHLRRRLTQLGLADDTILVFLGDNGTSGGCDVDRDGFVTAGYNAGLRGKKCWAYEGGHRAPCFVHWPAGGLINRDVVGLTAHLDLLPTLADLCGVPAARELDLDGTSLAEPLRGEAPVPDRTLVVHNQQVATPHRYKDFAVMRGRQRLVRTQQWGTGEQELFDLATDPGQRQDLATDQRETVRELLDGYEAWWSDVSTRFEEPSRIVVGTEHESPTHLTAHSWHGQAGIYDQRHVREGTVDNGCWPLEVAQAGVYELTLRRWPAELGLPLRAGLPERPARPCIDGAPVGQALPITAARARAGANVASAAVAADATAVHLRLELPTGPVDLQTWLDDEAGGNRGAYYLDVKRS